MDPPYLLDEATARMRISLKRVLSQHIKTYTPSPEVVQNHGEQLGNEILQALTLPQVTQEQQAEKQFLVEVPQGRFPTVDLAKLTEATVKFAEFLQFNSEN